MKEKNVDQKNSNLLIIIPWLIITIFFSVIFFFYPKLTLSISENRALATMPVFNKEAPESFPRDFEKFFNDQFPFRESFLKMFSLLELAQGKIKVRDLYISDGFLLPIEYLYPRKNITESTEKVNVLMDFIASTGKKSGYVSIPYKTYLYNYMLPSYLQTDYSEQNFKNFVSGLNTNICDGHRAYQTFSQSDLETFFFKADFHWNAKGAGVVFEYMMDWLAKECLVDEPIPDFYLEYSYLDNNYVGDLNRRYSFLFPTDEPLPVIRNVNGNIRYYLTFNSDEYTLDRKSISGDSLPNGETYNSIYTDNLGYYKMVNTEALLNTKVLVIKDSMQNPMTDMFSYVFNTSEIVDIRALKDISLYDIIKESDADLVLLMYHQNNVTGEMFNFK